MDVTGLFAFVGQRSVNKHKASTPISKQMNTPTFIFLEHFFYGLKARNTKLKWYFWNIREWVNTIFHDYLRNEFGHVRHAKFEIEWQLLWRAQLHDIWHSNNNAKNRFHKRLRTGKIEMNRSVKLVGKFNGKLHAQTTINLREKKSHIYFRLTIFINEEVFHPLFFRIAPFFLTI